MTSLPGYFEYRKTSVDENLFAQPFSYDHSSGLFVIGDQPVELAGFDPLTFDTLDIDVDPEGVRVVEAANYPALLAELAAQTVIGGPKLHEWAKRNPQVVRAAGAVMREAYIALGGEQDESGDEEESFYVTSHDSGGLHLQVEGSCACLSPEASGTWVIGGMEAGFAEYGLHNADTQPQRAALYAGIGHLAKLAND